MRQEVNHVPEPSHQCLVSAIQTRPPKGSIPLLKHHQLGMEHSKQEREGDI